MAFAQSLPENGKVITIEKFKNFADIARRNFKRNKLDEKIDLLEGDAFEILGKLKGREQFDFIFIDGNKEKYRHYMEVSIPLLSPGGIIAVDDCFFHGDALNVSPITEKGKGSKEALNFSATLSGWIRIALPISNGILLLTRE